MASKNLHRTSVELCRIVTKAEVIHRKRQVLALQSFRQDEKCAIHEIAGSATVLSLAVHGRKLNHTYGFGMFGPVTTEDLRSIEDTYKAWDAKASFRPGLEIDVCEHADPSAFDLLSKGYSVTGYVCQFQRYLNDIDPSPAPPANNVKVTALRTLEDVTDANTSYEYFINASIQGFRSGGRNIETLEALAESAVARSDTSLFSATIDGQLVGTAVMAIIDVDGCKVANLFMDSCLEHARGRGVHAALLSERIRLAKEMGCEMVIAAAREGSGSARNIERVGLRKIFTCTTYTKDGITTE
jgi:GNAT superfamily N-acetyltransferase